MVDVQANLEMFLAVSVAGVALILAAVAFLSFQRLRNSRALMISLGLLVFAAKGAVLTWYALQSRGGEPWVSTLAGFDLVVLVFLYLSIRTR